MTGGRIQAFREVIVMMATLALLAVGMSAPVPKETAKDRLAGEWEMVWAMEDGWLRGRCSQAWRITATEVLVRTGNAESSWRRWAGRDELGDYSVEWDGDRVTLRKGDGYMYSLRRR